MKKILITALVALGFVFTAMIPSQSWADNYRHHYRHGYYHGAYYGSGPKRWHRHHHKHYKHYNYGTCKHR